MVRALPSMDNAEFVYRLTFGLKGLGYINIRPSLDRPVKRLHGGGCDCGEMDHKR